MPTDLFDNVSNEDTDPIDDSQQGSFLEQLVGDGKKFADAEALAKGKHESDAFIETLKREQAELRRELDTRLSLEEFLDQQKTTPASGTPITPEGKSGAENVESLSKEQIATIVRDALIHEKTNATQSENLAYARQELIKQYGSGYADKLNKVAASLDLDKDFLNNMAATKPKAFLRLVAQEAKEVVTSVAPPRSSVRTVAATTSGLKNQAYYNQIKKSDPKYYWSAECSAERHQMAQKLGPAFFE
jgi:hypothetical protein